MGNILSTKNITKIYPGVVALDNVSLDIEEGEVMALCGENGAGKSTFIKILAGAIDKTSGTIFYQGKEVDIKNPHDAKAMGITIIYQELNLNTNLSIAENIFLGQEPLRKGGFVDWKKMYADAQEICDELGVNYDVRAKVGTLSIAQMQMVEIAKALSWHAKLLVMDEPTASLTQVEIDALFRTIEKLKAQGVTIIYISHRLEEIFQVSDRVTVFRDGKLISIHNSSEIDKAGLIKAMVGREVSSDKHVVRERGELVLEAKHINVGKRVKDVSFSVYKNEVLGFSGLVGAGRTEVMRAIFGADKMDSGEVYMHGKKIEIKSVSDAIDHGIALMTEDRKNLGLVLGMDIKENISITNIKEVMNSLFIQKHKESEFATEYVDKLKIKTPSVAQKTLNLSGGNQQKVCLAKWLFAKPEILIFDEPTRGIDVGAKSEIYGLIDELVKEGICVIVISSELPEIIQISDRIIVMHEGSITGELKGGDVTQEEILSYSVN